MDLDRFLELWVQIFIFAQKMKIKGSFDLKSKGYKIKFSQNQWVQNQSSAKSVGAAAPTTPTLTMTLRRHD